MNLLKNNRCYLSGAIDRCPNLGVPWRKWLSQELKDRFGIIPYDPMDKPIEIAGEHENRQLRKQWKKNREFDKLREFIREIRHVDLRMTDKSDFGVFYIDTDIHATGTYEELFWMVRSKKPSLVVCKQGVEGVPDWLFGAIPVEHMFDSWDELFTYLSKIDSGYDDGTNRWLFFNY